MSVSITFEPCIPTFLFNFSCQKSTSYPSSDTPQYTSALVSYGLTSSYDMGHPLSAIHSRRSKSIGSKGETLLSQWLLEPPRNLNLECVVSGYQDGLGRADE